MNEYPPLALFQQSLRQVLLVESDPQLIRQKLLDDPQLAVFKEFIEEMEPRMITTAAELIKKWH